MNEIIIIAITYILTFAVPLIAVGIGALTYDRLQKRKTRIGGNYRCNSCGFTFPQKTATISGYESHPNGLHINCPQCGHIIDQFLNLKQ